MSLIMYAKVELPEESFNFPAFKDIMDETALITVFTVGDILSEGTIRLRVLHPRRISVNIRRKKSLVVLDFWQYWNISHDKLLKRRKTENLRI